MIAFDNIYLNVNILAFLHILKALKTWHISLGGVGRGGVSRVRAYPVEYNPNVTCPDGEFSKYVVSSPGMTPVNFLKVACIHTSSPNKRFSTNPARIFKDP